MLSKFQLPSVDNRFCVEFGIIALLIVTNFVWGGSDLTFFLSCKIGSRLVRFLWELEY